METGMELKRLFCLLVCCELSAILALGNTFSSGIKDCAERRWSRSAFRKVFGNREQSDLKTGQGFKQLHSSVAGIRSVTNQSCTDALCARYAYRRSRRAALAPKKAFKTKPSELQLEPLPKPSQQNLPTDLPAQNGEFTTMPEEDYEDSTLVGPISGQPKGPSLPNPFYPLTGESYAAYTILLVAVIMFTAGIIGNITIMCTVCNNYYMRSVSNSLLANLALWDFLICFFCLPLVIFHHLTKDWLLGDLSCKLIPYIEVASLGVTTFTLCALCIDRFRAASNVQMYYETIENCASTTAKLAVIWLGALLLALPELLIHQLVTEEREVISDMSTPEPFEVPAKLPPSERCVMRISTTLPDSLYVLGLTYDSARLWWHFGCYFCLPTVFTIICSVVTAQKMRQAERTCVRGKHEQILFERRMNCTVVALAILYGFCVIPENVCNVISAYMAAGMAYSTLDILHLISQMLLFCKSALMPALLLTLCKTFSQTFLHCCCCCLEECRLPKSSSGTNDDNDNEGNNELELSPYSTVHREEASCTAVGTHC